MVTARTNTCGALGGLQILLVEDEPEIASPIAEVLADQGHFVRTEHDGERGLARLRGEPYDLVISDIRLPGVDGLELFAWVRRHAPSTSVVLMSAYGSIPEAVAALRQNAVHYLRKPFPLTELIDTVQQVAERVLVEGRRERDVTSNDPITCGVIGASPVMVGIRERLAAIAGSDASVLIHGETGTGKEVAARVIHEASARREGPFVAVNCGALPDTLFESELFGHERGAFTGAVDRRDGKFVAAEGGTLFLDEVTELSLPCQVKLLRVLEEGVVHPLGSNTSVAIDTRVLAATNRSLRYILGTGVFRADLFYRLRVLDVHLPPLRERHGDLPMLVRHFLERYAPSDGARPILSPLAWTLLRRYSFPGNVRELEHAIQHAIILSGGGAILPQHLPDEIQGGTEVDPGTPPSLSEVMAKVERELIVRTLDEVGWKKSRAAERLGISRKNLWERLRRHGVDGPCGDLPDDGPGSEA